MSLPGRDLDWGFETESNSESCLGMEDSCRIFQGKVLGGTSTINNMHYLRGSRQDYDDWEKNGCKGWSFDKILKYFKKSEKLEMDFEMVKFSEYDSIFKEIKAMYKDNDRKLHYSSKIAPGWYHSKTGTISVNHFTYDPRLATLRKALFGSCEEIGIPHVGDLNADNGVGCAQVLGTIHDGNRGNSAKSYLTPVKDRKNLFIVRNATVEKLIMEGKTAKGVKVVMKKRTLNIFAKKEIIVSAGAINSPRLLLMSGIGPKANLESAGVPLVHDLPGVGANLQAHLSFFGFPVALKKENSTALTNLQKVDAMYYFVTRGVGNFGNIALNDIVTLASSTKNNSVPDLQIRYYLNQRLDYYTMNELLLSLKFKDEIRDQYTQAAAKSNILLMVPTLLQPKSVGRVEITSPYLRHPPKITSGFLENKEDVRSLIKGIKIMLELLKTKYFQELGPELLEMKIKDCEEKFESDEHWECLIRYLTSSMHDVAGTCKMGPREDSMSVVDEKLNIHGLKGVRVVDSSIMPTIVRGSTSITSVMIGEKAADMIKIQWKQKKRDEL